MKLIDLLVQELPKRGGWPKGAVECCWFRDEKHLDFFDINGDLNRKSITPFDLTGVLFEPNEGNMQEIKKHEYEAALAESVWNGEGLPPVGCECEWQDRNTKHWINVCIVYASEWVTVIREDKIADPVEIAIENYGDEARRQFRPIRTEADRKRESFLSYCEGKPVSTYAELYDDITAGKIPGITTVPTASQIVHCTEKCSREDAERIVTMLKGEL